MPAINWIRRSYAEVLRWRGKLAIKSISCRWANSNSSPENQFGGLGGKRSLAKAEQAPCYLPMLFPGALFGKASLFGGAGGGRDRQRDRQYASCVDRPACSRGCSSKSGRLLSLTLPRALFSCIQLPQHSAQVFDLKDGAGEGNRTLVISLEGFCSRRDVADVLEKDNGWSHSILKSRGSEGLHFPLGPSCHPFVGRFVGTSYLLHITS